MIFEREKKLEKRAKRLIPIGSKLAPWFRSMEVDLLQSGTERKLELHLAMAVYSGLKTGIMFSGFLVAMSFIFELSILWKAGLILFPLFIWMMFYTYAFKPKVMVKKRARLIEQELPYALRHLLIEVKSGVPLYQSLVTISEGYGACSEEVRQIVAKTNAGVSNIDAIEESIVKNPSLAYRRSFWHVLNAMKSGTSLRVALEATVNEIIQNQLLAIKKYGQELNPWTLMYMMFGVILPSLGIAFMLILSTFVGFAVGPALLYGMLFFVAVFQLMFVNVIRSKRPTVKI